MADNDQGGAPAAPATPALAPAAPNAIDQELATISQLSSTDYWRTGAADRRLQLLRAKEAGTAAPSSSTAARAARKGELEAAMRAGKGGAYFRQGSPLPGEYLAILRAEEGSQPVPAKAAEPRAPGRPEAKAVAPATETWRVPATTVRASLAASAPDALAELDRDGGFDSGIERAQNISLEIFRGIPTDGGERDQFIAAYSALDNRTRCLMTMMLASLPPSGFALRPAGSEQMKRFSSTVEGSTIARTLGSKAPIAVARIAKRFDAFINRLSVAERASFDVFYDKKIGVRSRISFLWQLAHG